MNETMNKIVDLKRKISSLNKSEFEELISYLNDINKKNWLNKFIEKNKRIEITEEEIVRLVKSTRKEMYESSY